jgi:hypothetical protein
MPVGVPGHQVGNLIDGGRLANQRRLENPDLGRLRQPRRDRAYHGLAQDAAYFLALIVDVVVVPQHRTIRWLPVRQIRRPDGQAAVTMTGVEAIARRGQRVGLGVVKQFL